MLATLFAVAGVTAAVAMVVLLPLGHRWRRAGTVRALALSTSAAVVVGEVTARWLALPSASVVVAEAVLVAAALAMARARPAWSALGAWAFASLVVAEVAYLAYAAQVTLTGGLGLGAALVSAGFWALELAGLTLAATFAFEACDVVCRTRWDRPGGSRASGYRPFVSIHVAAYNEPPDMLIDTIRSLEALDYEDYEVVVVDNNTEDADVWKPVEAYCAGSARVRFVHVAPWPGFKSGALNLALDEYTDPRAEVIAVVDADYLVDPDWLRDLVGWFADPAVGFVQGPQDYDEWEGDAYLTACHDAYAYFFAAAMRSRNERNSAIFGGTMGLLRRTALERVGGWDEWCITEDAEVSVRLYAAGYQGVYVHESYGRGIMPLTFDALKRQRFRWCFGGLQLLRKHRRRLLPPWQRRPADLLSTRQRLDFLVGGLQWFTDLVGLAYAVVLAGSIAALLAGQPVTFRPLAGPAVVLPLSLTLAGALRAVWALRVLQGISVRRALLAFATWLSLSLTVAGAAARGLVHRDAEFLRTPKWHHEGGLVEALRATRVESTLAALLVAGVGVTLAQGRPALAAFGLWQAALYGCAPGMAWLNLHTRLSARLQRRRRSDERRHLRAGPDRTFARAGVVLAVAACVAIGVLVVHYPGPVEEPRFPRRDAEDAGPLGNAGVLPGDRPATTVTTEAPPASTAPDGGVAGDGADGTDGEAGDDGTSTTTAPTTTVPTSTTSTSRPGNGSPPVTPGRPDNGPPAPPGQG